MIITFGIVTLIMLTVSINTIHAALLQKHYRTAAFPSPLPDDTQRQPTATKTTSTAASILLSQTVTTDTTTIDRINALAETYSFRTAAVKDTALLLAERALALARQAHYKRGMTEALSVMSYRLNLEGKIERGLEAGFQGLRIAEELGDERLIARGLINIGFAAGQQSHTDSASVREAKTQLLKALAIGKSLRDDFIIVFSCNALGRLARIEGQQNMALSYHEQALALGEKIQNSEQTSWALHGLALIYESQKRYTLALDYARRGLMIRMQNGRDFAVATSLRLVGLIHLRQGHYAEAKRFAERSVALCKNADGLFLVKTQAFRLLSDAYLALNKPTEALQWFKLYIATKDSAAAIEAKENILQLQAQVDRERKEREQAVLVANQQIQEERIQRQRSIGIFIIVGIVLLSVAVAVLLRINRQKIKQNADLTNAYDEIQKQQIILEGQAQEIEITNTQLQELNATLEDSNLALNEANTFRLNMLSIAAHDLKNPLHTISSFAELLQEEPHHESSNAKDYAERIRRICERMLALIHDLLDTAAHDLGKMVLNIQPTNLSDLALAVTEQYKAQADEKQQQIILENSCECWVDGDVQRLYQVVENLLSNAIKYSPTNKRIWLSVVTLPDQNAVRLSVKDEGPGMTEEDQEKAFVMFQRLSAETTGGESSTGVGLALVKQIVELHGGDVRIGSEKGSGTEFTVTLPLYRAEFGVV